MSEKQVFTPGPNPEFQAVMRAIREWDGAGGHELRIGDADELAKMVLLELDFIKPRHDFTDAKEITLAIERSKNPITSAVAVIGLAAGVLEMRSGVDAAVRFLRAAADAVAENAALTRATGGQS